MQIGATSNKAHVLGGPIGALPPVLAINCQIKLVARFVMQIATETGHSLKDGLTWLRSMGPAMSIHIYLSAQ